jgi:two-component system, NarL family, response regulator LiaR
VAEIIRVLVVDDHPLMCHGIKTILEDEGDIKVVGEAHNGGDALRLARQTRPDVTLLDLHLPDMSGLEVIKEIMAENPDARILVFSNDTGNQTVFTAMEAGALSYMLKVDAMDRVVAAVRDAAQGNPTLSIQAERGLLTHIRKQNAPQADLESLTVREIEILKLMAEGLTNADMAARACIAEGTVRTHVSNIIQKLNLENRAQAIVYAIREGLVLLGE